jgi:outer membrane protein
MRKVLIVLAAATVWAQAPLSLEDAVRLGLRGNPSMAAAKAGVQAAETRIGEARSGYLPKVNYSESFLRSDNPVFVFGSLLTQHQFSMANFDIGSLNRPDFLDNFQSQITLDQPVFDAGRTRRAVESARLGHSLGAEQERGAQMELIAGIARAYWGEVLAAENLKAAGESYKSAQADLQRAESVHAEGMATDADVLSIRVQLAAVDERRIKARADLDVACAALNDALGLPLDTPHIIAGTLTPAQIPNIPYATWEQQAVAARPEARAARIATDLSEIQGQDARSALLPQVGIHTALEADRQTFATRGGSNWLVGVSLRWNVFNGGSDKQRIAESNYRLDQARADARRADSGIRLQVRSAWANLQAAAQRIQAAKAASAQAEESLRITQNRYRAGMATVTDLLRNESAVLDSRTRYLAAVHDQRIAATALELAAGELTPDSGVLK